MPYLSASAVVIHYEELLYQVYAPLALHLVLALITADCESAVINACNAVCDDMTI